MVAVTASAETTERGLAACLTKEWAQDVDKFAVAGDRASWDAYINASKCALLPKGTQVTVTDWSWDGYVEFAVQGVKLWAIGDAIK